MSAYCFELFRMPTGSMEPTIEPGDRFGCQKLFRPRRCDLVAYHVEGPDPSTYCKRLIALPGEKLRFENGDIYINDRLADVPPVLAGRCHAKIEGPQERYFPYADGQTITLGDDEYFFIGDNVDASKDSRTMGPSKGAAIVGVIDLIYWPLGRFRLLR